MDYINYTIHDATIQILLDEQTYWVSKEQLMLLFQTTEKEILSLIKKVLYNYLDMKNHYKKMPLIQQRETEWLIQANHYDLVFLAHLYQIYPTEEASLFIHFARRISMKKVCVIGSCVADVIVQIPALPKRAQDINALSQTMRLGGCAFNIAHMLSLYDIPFSLFSPVGKGIYGDFVHQHLQLVQIQSLIPRVDDNNGCCYCFVEDDGERSFISVHGAEYTFKKEWLSYINADEYDTYYICGIDLEDSGEVLVSFLETQENKTIYFAPGPRFQNIEPSLLQRLFSLSCILHLNEEEALRLSACKSYQESASSLYELTNNIVIITLGKEGAYLYDGNNTIHSHSPEVDVVDTIGAGDSHIGSFIAEQKIDHTLKESLLQANRIASEVVQTEGATLSKEQFKSIKI